MLRMMHSEAAPSLVAHADPNGLCIGVSFPAKRDAIFIAPPGSACEAFGPTIGSRSEGALGFALVPVLGEQVLVADCP